jgi:hypothetical protein
METEIMNSETHSELPLAEPHFDDEATVLSARRVVPLSETSSHGLQTESRFARGWMFAATVVGALLLGVVASAAYYSYLNREPPHPSVDMENIASGVDGVSTEPASNDALTPANAPEVSNATIDANPEVIVKQAPASLPQPAAPYNETRKPVAQRVDVLTFPSNRAERRAARRQAKEQRKELERESRDRKSRNDLTRIREIFEGPQKP